MSRTLTIQALGGLDITCANEPVSAFDSKKVAAILVYLASSGRTVPREVLAEMLWEDRTQSQSLANLRVALTSLRQTVGEFVTITRQTVGLNEGAAIWLDAAAFEAALDAGELQEAVDLYRGDFLAGFYVDSQAFEDWALRERERLRLRVQEALDALISQHQAHGDYAAGIACATRLLQMDPLREKTHRQLMLLLAESGERVAALAQYEKLADLLADELGVEPAAETQALFAQIQSGKPLHEAVDSVEQPTSTEVTNPYKGLRAFQEADANDFFGRDELVSRLLDRLVEEGPFSRFLAVVGPSGSGKSSVVKAGLLPALREGGLPGSEAWIVAEMVPGSHPFDELDILLARTAGDPTISLLDELRRDDRGLLRAVRRVLPQDVTDCLLVIDQFEEVFTLVQDTAEARLLLDGLYAAVTDPHSPLHVVITLRADFYDRPLMHPDFSQMIRQRTEAIVPMTTEELQHAVSGPAEQMGITLESGLVTTIVSEVTEQPGALPLLQYALTELFDHRENSLMTLAAYQTIGGTLGALARRADTVFENLTDNQQSTARQMFLRMVTLGEGTEDMRRRALQSELTAVGGVPSQTVLDVFDQSRLLTFDQDLTTQESTVELAHEAIIREWGMLHNWLDESREDVRLQRLLAHSASQWLAAGKDASYLLHGSRLAQFEGWASSNSVTLTDQEREFLNEGIIQRGRQNARRRRTRNLALTIAIAIAVVMTGVTMIAFDREGKAQREAEVRQSIALACRQCTGGPPH